MSVPEVKTQRMYFAFAIEDRVTTLSRTRGTLSMVYDQYFELSGDQRGEVPSGDIVQWYLDNGWAWLSE